MNKFLFKSTEADFQKLYTILETIQKNVLYLTYRTDAIIKKLNEVVIDKHLQHQVDEYFDGSDSDNPSDTESTSSVEGIQ